MKRILELAALVVAGVIVGNLVANPTLTRLFFQAITGLYSAAVGGLMGQVSAGSGAGPYLQPGLPWAVGPLGKATRRAPVRGR